MWPKAKEENAMHLLEKEMVSLLTELKEKYNVSGVKMEFEAEGTSLGAGQLS